MNSKAWRDNPWRRRAIFALGNFVVAITLFFTFVMPVHNFFSERSTYIVEQRAILAHLRAIVEQEPDVQKATRQIAEQMKGGEFVVGFDDGVINAELQTRLKTKAEQSGARLRSVQSLPPKIHDGVRYTGSRLDIFGSLQAIHRTVYAIENGIPYHFIAEAAIKPSVSAIRQGASEEPVIEARFDVFVATQIDGKAQ